MFEFLMCFSSSLYNKISSHWKWLTVKLAKMANFCNHFKGINPKMLSEFHWMPVATVLNAEFHFHTCPQQIRKININYWFLKSMEKGLPTPDDVPPNTAFTRICHGTRWGYVPQMGIHIQRPHWRTSYYLLSFERPHIDLSHLSWNWIFYINSSPYKEQWYKG